MISSYIIAGQHWNTMNDVKYCTVYLFTVFLDAAETELHTTHISDTCHVNVGIHIVLM